MSKVNTKQALIRPQFDPQQTEAAGKEQRLMFQNVRKEQYVPTP